MGSLIFNHRDEAMCECINLDSLTHAKCLCIFLFDHFKEWGLVIAINL